MAILRSFLPATNPYEARLVLRPKPRISAQVLPLPSQSTLVTDLGSFLPLLETLSQEKLGSVKELSYLKLALGALIQV